MHHSFFFPEKMMFFLFFLFYCHCNLFSCFLTDSYFFIQLPAFFFFLIPVILLFHPLFTTRFKISIKLFRDSTLCPSGLFVCLFCSFFFFCSLALAAFCAFLRFPEYAERLTEFTAVSNFLSAFSKFFISEILCEFAFSNTSLSKSSPFEFVSSCFTVS